MFRIFASLVLAVSATQPTTQPAADRTTVLGSVRVLWESIRSGDIDHVASSLDLPSPASQDFNHAVAEVLVAGKKLSDAASKRFGKPGQAIGRTMIDFANLDGVIQKLTVAEHDNNATVTGEQTKMQFHRRDNQWRLVVTDLADTKSATQPAQIKLLHDMATAVNEAAREIDSGKYTTVQEAERVIQDRLHAVMIEKFHPMNPNAFHPTTAPTTTPATRP